MADVALLFSESQSTSTHLVFGGTTAPTATDVVVTGSFPALTATVSLIPRTEISVTGNFPAPALKAVVEQVLDVAVTGTLPAPTLLAYIAEVTEVRVTGSFPALEMLAEATYISNTARPTVGQSTATHQVAVRTEQGPTNAHSDSNHNPVGWQAGFDKTVSAKQVVDHRLPKTFFQTPVQWATGFEQANQLRNVAGTSHQDANRVKLPFSTGHQDTGKLRNATFFKHEEGDRRKRYGSEAHWQGAKHRDAQRDTSFQKAMQRILRDAGRYQEARRPLVGISYPYKPTVPSVTPFDPTTDLLFSYPQTYSTHLLFQKGDYVPVKEPTTLPIQRVYIVINNANLRRASDNAVVPAFQMSMSLDAGSWTWGFDASLPATAQSLVEPTADGPVELKATVNGLEFRVLAENLSRERTFGQTMLRLSGRGRHALLDAPYAPILSFSNTEARTHQQLFDDVLTSNGISLGWTIDYGLESWNVPAGVFTHQGTFASALGALARAAGAYLIAHPNAMSFQVRPLYPAPPWQWGAVVPDYILPAALISRESIAWRDKPAYNRVFVSGQGQGVLGQVTRSGTAGDLLAPMVTDSLITTAAAARQRGLAVLSDTGRQREMGLRLPVLPSTGIIQPGSFVQYEEEGQSQLGIVRSTRVEVGMPAVFQSLGVECHA